MCFGLKSWQPHRAAYQRFKLGACAWPPCADVALAQRPELAIPTARPAQQRLEAAKAANQNKQRKPAGAASKRQARSARQGKASQGKAKKGKTRNEQRTQTGRQAGKRQASKQAIHQANEANRCHQQRRHAGESNKNMQVSIYENIPSAGKQRKEHTHKACARRNSA